MDEPGTQEDLQEDLKAQLNGLLRYIQRVREEIAAISNPSEEDYQFDSMGDQLDAIVAATRNAAECLGWQDQVGTLEAGKIAGAALDVYDIEPLPADHPLRRLDNTILSPHKGYVTEETYRVFYEGTVEAIRAWLDGTPVRQLTP